MTDNSATATYHSPGLSVRAWQSRAEAVNARPTVDDMTDGRDGEIVLEGIDGQDEFTASGGPGMHRGEKVPNFHPVHVCTPPATRSLPAKLATNPLPAARSRGQR